MPRSYLAFKSMSVAVVLTVASGCQAAEAVESNTSLSPWAFNLSLYTWLVGVNGDFSAGPLNKSVDANFIDIVGKLSNFPMAFMGRFEAQYDRLGFYLDGNYLSLDFRPRLDGGFTKGLSTVGAH